MGPVTQRHIDLNVFRSPVRYFYKLRPKRFIVLGTVFGPSGNHASIARHQNVTRQAISDVDDVFRLYAVVAANVQQCINTLHWRGVTVVSEPVRRNGLGQSHGLPKPREIGCDRSFAATDSRRFMQLAPLFGHLVRRQSEALQPAFRGDGRVEQRRSAVERTALQDVHPPLAVGLYRCLLARSEAAYSEGGFKRSTTTPVVPFRIICTP